MALCEDTVLHSWCENKIVLFDPANRLNHQIYILLQFSVQAHQRRVFITHVTHEQPHVRNMLNTYSVRNLVYSRGEHMCTCKYLHACVYERVVGETSSWSTLTCMALGFWACFWPVSQRQRVSRCQCVCSYLPSQQGQESLLGLRALQNIFSNALTGHVTVRL